MKPLAVAAEAVTSAPPDVVWALVADVSRYPDWGPWDAAGWEDGSALAVGGRRWLRLGTTTTREEILELDEGRSLVYTVLDGIPVAGYRADVTLSPVGRSTHVHWSATWDRTIGGRLVHRRLRTLYPEVVAGLVAAAEGRSRTT